MSKSEHFEVKCFDSREVQLVLRGHCHPSHPRSKVVSLSFSSTTIKWTQTRFDLSVFMRVISLRLLIVSSRHLNDVVVVSSIKTRRSLWRSVLQSKSVNMHWLSWWWALAPFAFSTRSEFLCTLVWVSLLLDIFHFISLFVRVLGQFSRQLLFYMNGVISIILKRKSDLLARNVIINPLHV